MSEGQERRSERIARYKEQRRKELAAQFTIITTPHRRNSKDTNSSSSEGPRTTKTSRLRAATKVQDSPSAPSVVKFNSIEKLSESPETGVTNSRRLERDKSSKRKSNLNRALNSEEVPSLDPDEVKNRRRGRRFFPQEVLQQVAQTYKDGRTRSENITTASNVPSTSPLSATASTTTGRLTPKKSELSIHMENARKGVTSSFSEMGRKVVTKRRSIIKSDFDSSFSDSKESSHQKSVDVKSISTSTKNLKKKMEEVTAITKETLARVERLASKNKDNKNFSTNNSFKISTSTSKSQPPSILKKKVEESVVFVEQSVSNTAPVSILKRKISQDDPKGEIHAQTPPVTFSPSVVEPTTTNRRQGILKKRRSLDENQVMRHRSCSPDVAAKTDSRSILKNQRRSSLEELTRTQSPELQLHGILKRKTSRAEEDDQSLNSPQGILKRKSGASSAGSTGSSPHVSITTAVILAAAGGAEMVLESPEVVKPILKKKSFSEENPCSETFFEFRKPILKKKSSTDTDENDENRPKKPILKMSRNSIDRDNSDVQSPRNGSLHLSNDAGDDSSYQSNSRPSKPRLSFCGEEVVKFRNTRRSHTICTEFNVQLNLDVKSDDRELKKPRPISVSELVTNFEGGCTGAIPKKINIKRGNERYRTQPVTSNELEASMHLVQSSQFEIIPKLSKTNSSFSPVDDNYSINSIFDYTSSLENDNNLNSFLSSMESTSVDNGVCCKMSSDSAFQSLGDGLELDQEDEKEVSRSTELEPNRLEMQMKAIAEEAQKIKLGRGSGVKKYRNRMSLSERTSSSRFSTQPVTFDEVQEASKITEASEGSDDKSHTSPSNLSVFDKIKLFNIKEKESVEPSPKREVPRRRLNRFQTQPVTPAEVNTARSIPSSTNILEDLETTEPRGILKSPLINVRCLGELSSPHPRSVLKKRDSFDGATDHESNRHSISKADIDVTFDEGISCNDSASDSETAGVSYSVGVTSELKSLVTKVQSSNRLEKSSSETSDGDSSGGREVRNIFKNENNLKVKLALEAVLSKSKSQLAFRDESEAINTQGSIKRSQTQSAMPRAIEEIQARLQQSGETGWKKRIQQNNNSNDELKLLNINKYNDKLSEKSVLEIKKDELNASSKEWKHRVEKSDAEKFSVAGRMEKNSDWSNLVINIPSVDKEKRTPQAKRFKGKEGTNSSSTPVSPEKSRRLELNRSYSVPYPDLELSGSDTSLRSSGRRVAVSRPDDFTFKSFYSSVETSTSKTDQIDLSVDDLDSVPRQSLLVQRKNIQVQKRRVASKNPIKALATRTDITNEYTEIITGVAERERKRLNIEKLAKSSNMAPAALAGLVSKEDFTSVALKKSSTATTLLPYKSVMLLLVKGRQHVQTRLVEPSSKSINEGDNFILVTPSLLFNYVGTYSNVIEQSRATDIINHIQKSGDLGCKEANVITINSINSKIMTRDIRKFWKTLGSEEVEEVSGGGHPDEDITYETNILSTNMIYKMEGSELVPFEEYWGLIPKIEMLQPTKVIVFDFGSEMYVWSGKNASITEKKLAFKLAKELWDSGYDYSDCSISPLAVASVLGNRVVESSLKTSKSRPDWALFAKITQHRETILFKEKFLDWPDFSRVIQVKGDQSEKKVEISYNLTPFNIEVIRRDYNPDLVIEGQHLGRGDKYFDEETKRLFEFDTLKISVWRINDNQPQKLDTGLMGQFFNNDSYIVKWEYRITVKGRELSGKPSRHFQAGRDKCVYFCWQGSRASINEKGSAALLTVELDVEKAPQLRIVDGMEPAAFMRLFKGSMIVCDRRYLKNRTRLFMVRGEIDEEVTLIEVSCRAAALRSRTHFILINYKQSLITIWNGSKSTEQKKRAAERFSQLLLSDHRFDSEVEIKEINEDDDEEFYDSIDGSRDSYCCLVDSKLNYDYTMRLFYLSSISGSFEATEVVCLYKSEFSSPFPFLQAELYSASQPALFLIDNHHELWLWQGWWPERAEDLDLSDQTGSGAVRWQAERKAAMQTAVNYWQKSHSGDESIPAYLVWAGLEPLEFKNLFPHWVDRSDVTELNMKTGKKESKILVERELALLSRMTYSLSELMQRPLPDGVDPTQLEIYLSSEDFHELLSMSKEEFQKLPMWKQTAVKKEKGLF